MKGSYDVLKDWVMDPKGYVLIRINEKTKMLELGHCRRNNEIETLIEGKTPQDVYFSACQKGLISRLDHAAYIGKELEKAFIAQQLGIPYVQDNPLDLFSFAKKRSKDK